MAKVTTSPLWVLLCTVFFFSANVLAVSAVLGIDLGTEYLKASLVKPGIPLDIVLTKDSRRKEVSAVAFKPPPNGPKANSYPERAYGSDAMALSARFPGDVYTNLKALLGLPTDSDVVTEYAARHPALQLVPHKLRGTAAFKSAGAFTPEEDAWMVEELLAMELQSIQKSAEAMAQSTVRSAVITVPPFFTVEERRAVELAAELAGFRVLSLISDGLAVGLNYATSRSFPNLNEGAKPEHHMVFDMGAGSTKATIMKFQSRVVKDVGKFNKTVQEIQVVGSGWDRTLGGDALNYLIVDDMIAKFIESAGAKKVSASAEGVKAHGRAIAKLTKEAERMRHVLSANQDTGASFEGLYEDVDFKYKTSRAAFEKMVEQHAQRVPAAVKMALKTAELDVTDLDSVILHGGATRTPFVQRELEKIFGADKLRSNVNADEAAVFGAGFRAADISPSFRVKEIRVSDGASYKAGLKWKTQADKPQQMNLYTAASRLGGPAKEVTFTNTADFSVEFYQRTPLLAGAVGASQDATTKVLTTKNLTATVSSLKDKYSCDAVDVQFKIGVRLAAENGEIEITKAFVQCEGEVQEKEGFVDGVKNLFGFGKKDEQKPLKDGESAESSTSSSSTATSSSTSASVSSGSAAASDSADSATAKTTTTRKIVSIPVDYELVKAGKPQLPKTALAALKDRLKAFEASDRARRQREEALNQLEGFTYKVRDLLENEAFIAASMPEERSSLAEKSSQASDWLYGEGADASKDELEKRHKELKSIADPIQNRIDEAAKRPELVAGLKDALKQTGEFVASIKKTIAEFEAFQSAESVSPTATPADSSSATPSPSTASAKDDFADLEDDDATKSAGDPEDLAKDRGPVPPLYTSEDMAELEAMHAKITAWLEKKEDEQNKLAVTANPVLTVKELTSWREKLDKAGLDLTMKGVRNFEKKKAKKAKASSSKSKLKKGSKDKKDGASTEPVKIKLGGEDGKTFSQEELEELLRQYQPPPADEPGQGSADGGGDQDAKPRVHEEL